MKGSLKELFGQLDEFDSLINSKIQKDAYELIKNDFKMKLDQLNNLAYYNPFYNVGNLNKLLLDYKMSKNTTVFLIGFVPKENKLYNYEIEDVLEGLKGLKSVLSDKIEGRLIYLYNNCFYILAENKERADYIRRIVKREKSDKISYISYYSEIAKESSKDLKNILKATNIIYEKLEEIKKTRGMIDDIKN